MSCEPLPLARGELRSAPWSVCATRALHNFKAEFLPCPSPECAPILSSAPRTGICPQQSSPEWRVTRGIRPRMYPCLCASAGRHAWALSPSAAAGGPNHPPEPNTACAVRTGLAYGATHWHTPSAEQPEWRCGPPPPTGELHSSCAPAGVKSAGHIEGTARSENVRLAVPYAFTQMNAPAPRPPRPVRDRLPTLPYPYSFSLFLFLFPAAAAAGGAARRQAAQRRLSAARAAAHRCSPAPGPPCRSRAC